ncbi:thioredoxin-like protein [Hypoxylon sp. NC0597]|nr:thioredoxin-like protein [Hypoxylon sp. NC0597]
MASIRDLLVPAGDGNAKLEMKVKGEAARVDTVSETTHFTVEFILDVLCPWCYIGLKNLNNAITAYKDRHPEATFEVTCSPFLLDPLAPRSAYGKPTYLNVPKYSIDQWAALGEPVGIKFSWKGRTGNTRDAHKLLRFALESTPTTAPSTAFAKRSRNQSLNQGAAPAAAAPETAPTSPRQADPHPASASDSSPQPRGPALQLRVLEALFKWHHESDGDLSDRRALTATAAAATGFSAADMLAVCESEEWGRAVDELFLDVTSPRGRRGLNIRAVPTFVVNDRYVIGGLQSRDFFMEEFERIGRGGGGGVGGGRGVRGVEGGEGSAGAAVGGT